MKLDSTKQKRGNGTGHWRVRVRAGVPFESEVPPVCPVLGEQNLECNCPFPVHVDLSVRELFAGPGVMYDPQPLFSCYLTGTRSATNFVSIDPHSPRRFTHALAPGFKWHQEALGACAYQSGDQPIFSCESVM